MPVPVFLIYGCLYFPKGREHPVAEPLTASFIALQCAIGIVKGLTGKAAADAAARVVSALRARGTPKGREVLESTQAAFVRSIQLMAKACAETGGTAADHFSGQALEKLAKDSRLRSSSLDESELPAGDLDERIRTMFETDIGGSSLRVADAIIAEIELRMGEHLTEAHRKLFRHGSPKHPSWADAFELFFADAVRTNQRVFRAVAFDRLNEILAFADRNERVIDQVLQEVDDARCEMRERFDRLEALISKETGIPLATLRVIVAGFGDDLESGVDAAAIEKYLRDKATEYATLKDRFLAAEAQDNHSRALLGAAQDAIDAGDFDVADTLIAEAEDHDDEISRQLRSTADARDLARAAKRALRGATAMLRGDARTAIDHYDTAIGILRTNAAKERTLYASGAAQAALELCKRSGHVEDSADSLRRWRAVLGALDRAADPETWAHTQVGLAGTLHCIGERSPGLDAFREASTAYEEASTYFTKSTWPSEWATIQANLGGLFTEIGKRSASAASFELGIEALEAALGIHTRQASPGQWATLQSNLGVVYSELAQRDGNKASFDLAIGACKNALEVRTKEDDRMGWARTKIVLGSCQLLLGKYSASLQLIEDSITTLRDCLHVYTEKDWPLDWATVQTCLGVGLRLTGVLRQDSKLVQDAVAATRSSLRVYTPVHLPVQWGQATNNLGVSLQTLAGLEDDLRYLLEAEELYRQVTGVFSMGEEPVRWALATENLGVIQTAIAAVTRDAALADNAIACLEGAVEVFADPSLIMNRRKAELGLAEARNLRKKLQSPEVAEDG